MDGMRRISLEDTAPCIEVLTVEMPYAEFVQWFGEKHSGHPPDWNAPGPVELWFYELPWGLRLVLEYHPSNGLFVVYLDVMEIDAVVGYLGLHGRKVHVDYKFVTWLKCEHPRFGEGLERFSLYRQDDNGNVALIHTYESQRVADYYRKVYEDRGHRQLYWVAREDTECDTAEEGS